MGSDKFHGLVVRIQILYFAAALDFLNDLVEIHLVCFSVHSVNLEKFKSLNPEDKEICTNLVLCL